VWGRVIATVFDWLADADDGSRKLKVELVSTSYRRHRERAPESELRRYLEEANAVLAASMPASGEPIDHLVSADFEHLRRFDLPPVCLAGTTLVTYPTG
jgi:hypothetical protein